MAKKLPGEPKESTEDQRQAADQFLATEEGALRQVMARDKSIRAKYMRPGVPLPETIGLTTRRKLEIILRMRRDLKSPLPNYTQLFFDATTLLTIYAERDLWLQEGLHNLEMARRARLPRRSRYHKEHQECFYAIAELRKDHPTMELAAVRRLMLDRFSHLNPRTVANWVISAFKDNGRN